MGANDPGAWPIWTPEAHGWQVYVGDHQTLLHTKSVSSEPHGFREEDF